MEAKLQIKVDRINSKLDGMTNRIKGFRSYLNRVVYAQYQVAQLQRWKSAGSGEHSVTTSESDFWKSLDPKYYESKKKKFKRSAYGGNQFLVATGELLKTVIQPDKIAEEYSLTLRVMVPYAQYVAETRPFMSFGSQTRQKIIGGMRDYILKGKS